MPDNSLALLTRLAQSVCRPLPCQRQNPQLWFSDLPPDLELAKAHRAACPYTAPAWPTRSSATSRKASGVARIPPAAQSPPGSGHVAAHPTRQKDTMHPLILQQLAADRVNDMIAKPTASGRRAAPGLRDDRGRGPGIACRARRPNRRGHHRGRCQPGPRRPGLPAGGDQGRELVRAERAHTRAR